MKKALSILLVLVMGVSLFSGCAKNKKNNIKLSSVKDFEELIDIVGQPYEESVFSGLDFSNGISEDEDSGFDGNNFWFGYKFDGTYGESEYENNNILSDYTDKVPTDIEIECFTSDKTINSLEIYYDSLIASQQIIDGFVKQFPNQQVRTNSYNSSTEYTFTMTNSRKEIINCEIQLYTSGETEIILEKQ